jgi:hypothetical protein
LNCLGRPCNEQSLRAYIMKAVKDARKSKVVEVSDDDDDDDDDDGDNDDIDDDNNDDDNDDAANAINSDGVKSGTEPETPAIVRAPVFVDLTGDDDNGQNVGVAGVATIANRSYIVISDDEDDGADSIGETPDAARQNATVNVVDDDQDDGAVYAGEKRKVADIVEPASKTRKLDLVKQYALRRNKEAHINRMESPDTRAGLINSVNVRESRPFIGRPALLLGPDHGQELVVRARRQPRAWLGSAHA